MAPPTSGEWRELKRFIVRAIEHHHAILDRPNVSISVPEPLAGYHVENGPQDGERFSSCALGRALRSENIDWADFCFMDVEQEEDSGYVGAFSFSPSSGLAIIREVKKANNTGIAPLPISEVFFQSWQMIARAEKIPLDRLRIIGMDTVVNEETTMAIESATRASGSSGPVPSRRPVADSSRPWAANIEDSTFNALPIEIVFLSTYRIVE